jgi:hypothetical protein
MVNRCINREGRAAPALRACLLVALAGALTPCPSPAAGAKADATKAFTPEQVAFYQKQVLPVLQKNCFKCHSGKKARGGLRLDSRAALLKGGDLGPALLPARPDDSPLLKAVRYKDGLEMPPSGKLPAGQIDLIARWAKMGAPYAAGREEVVRAPAPKEMKVTEADRNYWAYRPLRRPAVPAVRNAHWAKTPIDAFVLAKLEANGLTPAAPAGRVALIRRACYDLTGLPPTPAEVDAFVEDKKPDAYERLVDRLLASPAYGEKWGRHWLDLVRFAETNGYERDGAKPFAWRYRDYVIDAFNDDTPYDRFLTEQLAGDELPRPTVRTLTATGYYRLGIWDDEPADRLLLKYDVLDGVVSTTAQVALGMSVGCARCHDHKKDPIPQKDYYRLLACFSDVADMDGRNLRRVAGPEERRRHQERLRAKAEREGKLYQEQYRIEQQFLAALQGKKDVKVGALVGSDMIDLRYRFYRDTWERLPDFDAIKAEDAGRAAGGYFSLTPASRKEAFGLVFEGKLKVPAKGVYTFFARSTEGVRLLVNGKAVIDRPAQGSHTAEGKLELPAGLAGVRLEYFNTYRRPALQVAWEGPGVARRPLSDDGGDGPALLGDARTAAGVWQYTTTRPARNWARPDFDASGWKKGRAGFGQAGTPGAVVRTPWTTQHIWLRKTFEAAEKPAGLTLHLHHDDDVEVYLNGRLVHRARGYLVDYQRIPLAQAAAAALRRGTNVLAVHCRQTTGGQYVDAGLVADSRADLETLLKQHGGELLGEKTLARYREVKAELERSRKTPTPEPGVDVMCVVERGRSTTRVLVRGNPHAPGEEVSAGFPEVLGGGAALPATRGAPTSGKRLALARWLTDAANPATPRVMANRLWQYHFGRGIVPTSSDFGKLGESPTHPELLDWLAAELRDSGWALKRLHRLVMLSSAYRMSSQGRPEALAKDPANNLFWRFNMRRLTAEEVRDSMLAAGGTLNRRMAGPGVYPTIPRAVLAGQSVPGSGWGRSPPREQARRSVYVHLKRSLVVPILETHDLADTDSSCAVRYTTTVPTQALAMLNGEFTNEQAASLADRLRREHPGDLAAQVRRAVRLTTGRTATADEVRHDVRFIEELRGGKKDADEALTLFCLLALNANEFLYLD